MQAAKTPRSSGAACLAAEFKLWSICCPWSGGSAGTDAVLASCSTLNVVATAAALLAVTPVSVVAFCIAKCCDLGRFQGVKSIHCCDHAMGMQTGGKVIAVCLPANLFTACKTSLLCDNLKYSTASMGKGHHRSIYFLCSLMSMKRYSLPAEIGRASAACQEVLP